MNRCDSQYDRLLSAGWKIQVSSEVKGTPDQISQPGFDTRGWYSTSVPSTVLAALVENGVHENPYFGMNLKEISSEPFSQPWWYRTQFRLWPQEVAGTVLLEFDGINYSANIWLNGNQVAASNEVKGAFRRFQYDVSKLVLEGNNVLAIEVIPPKPGDFSTGFVDWNPSPPD
ncbi:MAG: sugar-binding domain-containing protein, partial [Planctomycetota bacterium]